MESSFGSLMMAMKSNKYYIGSLLIQAIYAGMALLSKAAISRGMNPYIFVFYRQAFATLALLPFALILERKNFASLSFKFLCTNFFVSVPGITLSSNLYCVGINYTSATLAAASTNTIPAITFIMALLFRMESISIKKRHGLAKVLGTVVGLCGALVFFFVKGPPIFAANQTDVSKESAESRSTWDWIKGSLIMLTSNTAWSLYLILQGPLVKQYPAKIRLTTLQCLMSCIQSAVWAVAMERKASSWKLGWDVNLLSVAYCGIIVSAVAYCLRVWVIEAKGPVFAATFTPFSLIMTAICSAILWKEALHWGSACGALLLVGGLYSVLWGKHREAKAHQIQVKSEEPRVETT